MPEPNRAYVVKYKDMLELNNRKPRTFRKKAARVKYFLKLLLKDVPKVTKEDIDDAES